MAAHISNPFPALLLKNAMSPKGGVYTKDSMAKAASAIRP